MTNDTAVRMACRWAAIAVFDGTMLVITELALLRLFELLIFAWAVMALTRWLPR